LAALRSGEYAQGRDSLKRDGKFCCLGVLCDIVTKEHPELGVWQENFFVTPDGEDRTGLPPEAIADFVGLQSADPYVADTNNQRNSVTYFNDKGVPFSEIAEMIERNL
jgi:hypothetical protein